MCFLLGYHGLKKSNIGLMLNFVRKRFDFIVYENENKGSRIESG
jgi:hypothetical protein